MLLIQNTVPIPGHESEKPWDLKQKCIVQKGRSGRSVNTNCSEKISRTPYWVRQATSVFFWSSSSRPQQTSSYFPVAKKKVDRKKQQEIYKSEKNVTAN
jgi:hypothetical protein